MINKTILTVLISGTLYYLYRSRQELRFITADAFVDNPDLTNVRYIENLAKVYIKTGFQPFLYVIHKSGKDCHLCDYVDKSGLFLNGKECDHWYGTYNANETDKMITHKIKYKGQ